jgi:hypothetical protein
MSTGEQQARRIGPCAEQRLFRSLAPAADGRDLLPRLVAGFDPSACRIMGRCGCLLTQGRRDALQPHESDGGPKLTSAEHVLPSHGRSSSTSCEVSCSNPLYIIADKAQTRPSSSRSHCRFRLITHNCFFRRSGQAGPAVSEAIAPSERARLTGSGGTCRMGSARCWASTTMRYRQWCGVTNSASLLCA